MSQYLYLSIIIIKIVAHRRHVIRYGGMYLVNKTLDHICVLWIKIESLSEVLKGSIYHAFSAVYFTDHNMDRCLLWNLVLKFK